MDDALGVTARNRRSSLPVVLPAAAALAELGEWGRRRREHLDAGLPADGPQPSKARALAFGLGVTAGTSAAAGVERAMANRIAHSAAAVLPGDAAIWRPLGHAISLGAFVAAGRFATHKAFTRIESHQEAVETAFDIAPPSRLLSGSYESEVPFATLSVRGRRFVWMATPADLIAKVLGEPAVAQPIRVYVGLASGWASPPRGRRACPRACGGGRRRRASRC